MKFGEKLKKLRTDNGLTQNELADKIYVSRTAVSKWETDNGYPSIESLKMLTKVFHVTLDELVSDEDIANKKALDDKNAKVFFGLSVLGFILAVLLSFLSKVLRLNSLLVLSGLGVVLYVICAYFSAPKYLREERKSDKLKFFVPKIIAFLIIFFALLSGLL